MTRRNLLKSLAIAAMLPVAQVFGHKPDAICPLGKIDISWAIAKQPIQVWEVTIATGKKHNLESPA